MVKKINVIEPVKKKNINEYNKLRVAAYCRVSTDLGKQLQSYKEQASYYEDFIKSQPNYEFAGIYADESSGTKIKNRDEFIRLIEDCKQKKIDLIITKSITRFARNTVDCIRTIRELKDLKIAVFFEKENLNTLTEESEFMLTLLSSIAQSESENISDNTMWSINKRFTNGTYKISTPPYGYIKNEDGELIIDETRAPIVRRIFNDYINGKGAYTIAKELTSDGIVSYKGQCKWSATTVRGILVNPTYKGTLLLQKTYTVSPINSVRKINRGEYQMYSIENNHEGIITPDEFNHVKDIRGANSKKNKSSENKMFVRYLYSEKINCEICGSRFRRVITNIGKPYEKIRWSCMTHLHNIKACNMKAIYESDIHSAFIDAWNKLVSNKDILNSMIESIEQLKLKSSKYYKIQNLDNDIEKLKMQYRYIEQVMHNGSIDTAIFISKKNELLTLIDELKLEKENILIFNEYEDILLSTKRLLQIVNYNQNLIYEYDENLFNHTCRKIIVSECHTIKFELINGLKIDGKLDALFRTKNDDAVLSERVYFNKYKGVFNVKDGNQYYSYYKCVFMNITVDEIIEISRRAINKILSGFTLSYEIGKLKKNILKIEHNKCIDNIESVIEIAEHIHRNTIVDHFTYNLNIIKEEIEKDGEISVESVDAIVEKIVINRYGNAQVHFVNGLIVDEKRKDI